MLGYNRSKTGYQVIRYHLDLVDDHLNYRGLPMQPCHRFQILHLGRRSYQKYTTDQSVPTETQLQVPTHQLGRHSSYIQTRRC